MASTPAWAAEARAAAKVRLANLPSLSGQEEEWRFTPPSDLALEGPAPEGIDGSGASATSDGAFVFTDGAATAVEPAEGLPDGVIVAELGAALDSHEDLVRERLYSLIGFDDKPGAMNAAQWGSGLLVYVPRGAEVEVPITAITVASGAAGHVFGRTLVVVDEGARCTIVERYDSPDLAGAINASTVAEIFVGPGAHLEHVSIIGWGEGMRHHALLRAETGRDATARSVVVTLGGDVVRVEPTMVCAGPGARAHAYGLCFASGDQHFEHRVIARHEAPQSYSNLLYKGAIQDSAHTVFFGNLVVPPGAPGTDAYQTNRNLVLNEGARADTIPFLEIETAEVRCSHAGAISRVDDEHLFYLRSRGVPEDVAKRLIVFGFFQEVLEEIQLTELREELEAAVAAKIR